MFNSVFFSLAFPFFGKVYYQFRPYRQWLSTGDVLNWHVLYKPSLGNNCSYWLEYGPIKTLILIKILKIIKFLLNWAGRFWKLPALIFKSVMIFGPSFTTVVAAASEVNCYLINRRQIITSAKEVLNSRPFVCPFVLPSIRPSVC